MRITPFLTAAFLSAALISTLTAGRFIDGFRESEEATGDWGGLRPRLEDKGFKFTVTYVNNIQGNVVGGNSLGAAYDHNLAMQLQLDLEKLVHWQGGRFVISALDRTGRNLSGDHIGNQFTVSQLWGNPTFVFYGLWLEQDLFDGKLNLKLGRIAAGDDMASSPLYWLYVNNGIDGNPQAIPVNTSFTCYPNATWGARIKFQPHEEVTLQYGIYQATDRLGNPRYHGMDFSIRPNDGITMAAQAGWSPEFNKKPVMDPVSEARDGKATTAETRLAGLPGNYWVGAYYTHWQFSEFNGPGVYQNNYGFYAHADQTIWQESPGSLQGLTLWTAMTFSPQQEIAKLPFMAMGGVVYRGLIPTRDRDETVFGIIYGLFSDEYAAAQKSGGFGSPTYELVFEWAHRFHVTESIYFEPDIQWVIRPGGTGNIPNALVLGAQMGVNF